jgi:hypothetical protein
MTPPPPPTITPPIPVFVPFFRENLSLSDFREILNSTCTVQRVSVHTKTNSRKQHFYAFLFVYPNTLTKIGRSLAKNLRNQVSTFVPYDDNRFLEMKSFLSKEQRIDRGYTGTSLYFQSQEDEQQPEQQLKQQLEQQPEQQQQQPEQLQQQLEQQPEPGCSIFKTVFERRLIEQEYDELVREIEFTRPALEYFMKIL